MNTFKLSLCFGVLLLVQLALAQEDLSDSLDAPSSGSAIAVNERTDSKPAEPSAGESIDEEKLKPEKPRKTTFKEERFEKLFNTRNRKPRLPPPKFNLKPKPTLPSFFKSAPNVKPLSELDEPTARPATTSKPKKAQSGRLATTSTTTTVSPAVARARARNGSNSSKPSDNHNNPKNGPNDASESSRKRFTSGRGRGTSSRTRTSGSA